MNALASADRAGTSGKSACGHLAPAARLAEPVGTGSVPRQPPGVSSRVTTARDLGTMLQERCHRAIARARHQRARFWAYPSRRSPMRFAGVCSHSLTMGRARMRSAWLPMYQSAIGGFGPAAISPRIRSSVFVYRHQSCSPRALRSLSGAMRCSRASFAVGYPLGRAPCPARVLSAGPSRPHSSFSNAPAVAGAGSPKRFTSWFVSLTSSPVMRQS